MKDHLHFYNWFILYIFQDILFIVCLCEYRAVSSIGVKANAPSPVSRLTSQQGKSLGLPSRGFTKSTRGCPPPPFIRVLIRGYVLPYGPDKQTKGSLIKPCGLSCNMKLQFQRGTIHASVVKLKPSV